MASKTAPKHILIPKHTKISEKDKKALFKEYEISLHELPKIFVKDPAIAHLSLKQGDVVKIERDSRVAGKISFYRGVIDE